MAAVLTTISVEVVKTPVIRKSHSSETPDGQDFKSKSCGSGELGEDGPSIGACENLRMAAVLTTSSHILVKTAAICKRCLLKTC